jgi:protein SCO1
MFFRPATLMRAATLLGTLLVGLILWFALARPLQVLPRMQLVPAFTLTNQSQQWVSEADLLGRMTLVSFGYSECGEACSALEATLQRLYQQQSLDVPLQLLTISLDPERDSPVRLAEYARTHAANPQQWHFLTGSARDVRQLVGGGFGIYYQKTPPGSVQFEQQLILIDQTGRVRGRYLGSHPDLAILQRDLHLLEREARESVGSQRLIYEAAHLFVCYPQ